MKRTALLILCAIVTFSSLRCLAATRPPLSKMAVKIVDETGSPVSNAYVRVRTYWKEGLDSGKMFGFTETNGVFRYNDRVYREIGYTVKKKGHYDSRGEAWWPKKNFEVPETNLIVVLKRIIDPVPLVLKDISVNFPRLDEPVGFDFEIGDWVTPDGKGKKADMTLTATKRFTDWKDYSYQVKFAFDGSNNGIQMFSAPSLSSHGVKSSLIPPQVAPETGYTTTNLIWNNHPRGGYYELSEKEGNFHVFRIRTQLDKQGRITSANVGWTYGDFGCSPTDNSNGFIQFKYYYNPDPTSRSLEPKEIADQQAKDIPLPKD